MEKSTAHRIDVKGDMAITLRGLRARRVFWTLVDGCPFPPGRTPPLTMAVGFTLDHGLQRVSIGDPRIVEELHATGPQVVLGADDGQFLASISCSRMRLRLTMVFTDRRTFRSVTFSTNAVGCAPPGLRLVLFVDRGLDLREQLGEVSHFHVVARALDGAAAGVADHDDEPGARQLAGELEAADDVGVHDGPGDAHREDVAEALIEDESDDVRLSMQLTMVANGHWPSRVSLACWSRLRLTRRLLMNLTLPSFRNSSARAGVMVAWVSDVWAFMSD